MREIFIGERYIRNRWYEYYLLVETEERGRKQYGVKIASDGDEAALRDVTVSRQDIQTLGELLMEFLVTPVSLRDVVEDWLARD